MLTMAAEHAHHGHAHVLTASGQAGWSPERRLLIALVLTVAFMVVEAIAGWLVHSLALLSDAGHMLADAGSLGLALTAQRVASRPRTLSRTYGYRRAETLAALANGIVLCMTALWVIAEAIARWKEPAPDRRFPDARGGDRGARVQPRGRARPVDESLAQRERAGRRSPTSFRMRSARSRPSSRPAWCSRSAGRGPMQRPA